MDNHVQPYTHKEGCGISTPSSQARILGGTDAGYGQFPWTARITVTGDGLHKVCAGTLVHDRYILTAGHCVRFCHTGTLHNCTHHIPFAELTFKVTLGQTDTQYKSSTYIQRLHAVQVYL